MLLNNTIKHAQPIVISLCINLHGHHLNYTFEDNGISYSKNTARRGIGFKNIKERTTAINTTFNIYSHPQRDTHITIEVPIL